MSRTCAVAELIGMVAGGLRTFDLSRPYTVGMPQSPNHPAYWHSLPRRHGDRVRQDGGSAANDVITMGTHVGTHIDALSHVSQDGFLHGDVDAAVAQVGGRFSTYGIEQLPPLLCRGLLLDVPAARGGAVCPPGDEVTPEDLDRAESLLEEPARPGDVLLVRSGWGQRWDEGDAYVGRDTGVPGVGEEGARWLAAREPTAVGADTIAFEQVLAGKGHACLPAHRILLVDRGINIIETLNLEALAEEGVTEFLFIGIPLPLVGATGSPLRPLAVLPGVEATGAAAGDRTS